jgi:hypothetical protein
MAKRQKLDYNSDDLAASLKQSTGQGVDALFSQPSSPSPTKTRQEDKRDQVAEQSHQEAASYTSQERHVTPEPAQAKTGVSPTKQPTNVRTNEQMNEEPGARRQKIRHTFDIFADQILSLKEIQLEREKVLGRKYRIGDLAQEALDMLITKEQNNERTFVKPHPTERSDAASR